LDEYASIAHHLTATQDPKVKSTLSLLHLLLPSLSCIEVPVPDGHLKTALNIKPTFSWADMVEEDEEAQRTQSQESLDLKTDIENPTSSTEGQCLAKTEDIKMSWVIEETDVSVAEAPNMLDQECTTPDGNIEIAQMEEKVAVLEDNLEAAAAEVPLPESDEKHINFVAPHGQSGPAPVNSWATILKSAPATTTVTTKHQGHPQGQSPNQEDSSEIKNAPSAPAQIAGFNVHRAVPTYPFKNKKEAEQFYNALERLKEELERADGWEKVQRKLQRTKDIPAAASPSTLMPQPSQVNAMTLVSGDTPVLTKSQKRNKKRREKERMAKQKQAQKQQKEQGQSTEQEASSSNSNLEADHCLNFGETSSTVQLSEVKSEPGTLPKTGTIEVYEVVEEDKDLAGRPFAEDWIDLAYTWYLIVSIVGALLLFLLAWINPSISLLTWDL
jgi:hypothetical protein